MGHINAKRANYRIQEARKYQRFGRYRCDEEERSNGHLWDVRTFFSLCVYETPGATPIIPTDLSL